MGRRGGGATAAQVEANDYLKGSTGRVLINGVLATWVAMAIVDNYCIINATISTRTITHGPAVIEVQARTLNASDAAILDTGPVDPDTGAPAGVPIGRSVGKLYVYHDPSAGLQLIEPVVTNGPACQTVTVIRIPTTTQARIARPRFAGRSHQCHHPAP